MEQHGELTERRILADRRARPTTFCSTLRWRGRRKGFRRAGEERSAYVDCLTRRIVVLVLLVLVSSVLDALLTLLHLQDGGGEANPLMALALAHSHALFLALKLSITGVLACFLAVHHHYPLAQSGLRWLTVSYGVVLAYHLLLFLTLV